MMVIVCDNPKFLGGNNKDTKMTYFFRMLR